MKQLKLFGIIGAVLLTMVMTNVQAEVLFDLSTVKLSGTTGANTFVLTDNGANLSIMTGANEGNLRWNTNTKQDYSLLVIHFDKQTLTAGQSLQLDYTIGASNANNFQTGNQTMRIGMFDAKGSLVTSNTVKQPNDLTSTWRGYAATYSPRSSDASSENSFYTRYQDKANPLMATTSFTSTGTRNVYGWEYADPTKNVMLNYPGTGQGGNLIIGSFIITMGEDNVVTLSSIIGTNVLQSYTISDGGTNYASFDTLVFQFSTTALANEYFRFSNLTLSLIPEPSTFALLGVGALLVVGCSRFRKQRMRP